MVSWVSASALEFINIHHVYASPAIGIVQASPHVKTLSTGYLRTVSNPGIFLTTVTPVRKLGFGPHRSYLRMTYPPSIHLCKFAGLQCPDYGYMSAWSNNVLNGAFVIAT